MAETPRRTSSGVRGGVAAHGGVDLGNSVWVFTNNGVPSDGVSGTGAGWAGPGSLCIDRANGELYTNTNTKASPTWTNQT